MPRWTSVRPHWAAGFPFFLADAFARQQVAEPLRAHFTLGPLQHFSARRGSGGQLRQCLTYAVGVADQLRPQSDFAILALGRSLTPAW